MHLPGSFYTAWADTSEEEAKLADGKKRAKRSIEQILSA
jgi:hypothetical protein